MLRMNTIMNWPVDTTLFTMRPIVQLSSLTSFKYWNMILTQTESETQAWKLQNDDFMTYSSSALYTDISTLNVSPTKNKF